MNTNLQDHRKQGLTSSLNTCGWVCLLTIIFLFVSSMSAIAEPSLLWRMKFDSRIIKTSDLKDFKVKAGKKAEFPLKAVMTEKSILLLDKKGKIEKKIPLEDYAKVAMSDDGTTIATMQGREITVATMDGQIRGKVKIGDPQPVVLPQHVSFELSPNGEYIVVISYFTNTIYFHARNGNMLSKKYFNDLRGAEITFPKNSRYVAIHVPNWGKGNTRGYLLFFNNKGENLWQFDHKGTQAKFDISSNSNSIVLALEDRLYSLNKRGKIIYEKELVPGGIHIALSGDGKYLALARETDHSVSMLDNQNGHVLWFSNITGFDPINSPVTFLNVSDKGNCITVAISKDWSRRNNSSSLFMFDKSGNLLWRNTFETDKIRSILSRDGHFVWIDSNKEAFVFRHRI